VRTSDGFLARGLNLRRLLLREGKARKGKGENEKKRGKGDVVESKKSLKYTLVNLV